MHLIFICCQLWKSAYCLFITSCLHLSCRTISKPNLNHFHAITYYRFRYFSDHFDFSPSLLSSQKNLSMSADSVFSSEKAKGSNEVDHFRDVTRSTEMLKSQKLSVSMNFYYTIVGKNTVLAVMSIPFIWGQWSWDT